MSDSEEQTAKIPELEKGVKQAKEDYARYEQGSAERVAGLQAQLAGARQQLEAAEVNIPPNFRGQYNRIVNARGPDALAAVKNRTCTACYTEITAQNYNDILQGLFVLCKSCDRILYLPESSPQV